jgi:hypothetical protein
MKLAMEQHNMLVDPASLHVDDSISELDHTVTYNWRDIYGYGPSKG